MIRTFPSRLIDTIAWTAIKTFAMHVKPRSTPTFRVTPLSTFALYTLA
ncbi:Unknown protein sequence [Pseudomonas amygdali pv. morsprunorum]|nr:Unknown protein sequence [Pseudomonas amygdali pv. morsprunorum]